MTKTREYELYATEIEQEAYDLGGQLTLPPANCRSYVSCREDKYGKPYYVVMVKAPEAVNRAIEVRKQMFGS